MTRSKTYLTVLAALALSIGLSACGDTWRGVKTDTGQNLEATGKAVERTGEKVNPNKP